MFHLCALILSVFNAVFSYFLITLRTLHFSPPCMLSFHMLSHHTFDYVCVITNRMISTLLKCFTIFHCFDVTLKITFKWAIETFCHCELILCVFGDFDLCLLHNHNLCIKMFYSNVSSDPLLTAMVFPCSVSMGLQPIILKPDTFRQISIWCKKKLFDTYSSAASYCQLELQTKNIRTFHNHGEGPY